jgi:hypothetical protein
MTEFFPNTKDAAGAGVGASSIQSALFPAAPLLADAGRAEMGPRAVPSEALAEARRRIQTDGVTAAVTALIDVCRDAKAPAPAKASAGAALLRAAGLFSLGEEGGDFGKSPSEMSPEELRAAIARIKRDLSTRG